jgi:hypothetical protein
MTSLALDIGAILDPISGDSAAGIHVKPLGIYDKVKGLRTTESSEGMLGTLRLGQYTIAQWDQVVEVCVGGTLLQNKGLATCGVAGRCACSTARFGWTSTGPRSDNWLTPTLLVLVLPSDRGRRA